MKILLIKPETVGIFSFTYLVDHEPLEMEYLYTAFTRNGHGAVIYDRRYEAISLKRKLNKEKPDVVCITGYITQEKLIKKLCVAIKKYRPSAAIILGGSHVELNYENFYDSCADYLYRLSGLDNMCRLLDYIEGSKEVELTDIPGICYKKDGEWVCNRKIVETPEDLPVPDRTHFYKNSHRFRYLCFKPLALVKNSYSCQKKCNFCFCTNRNGGRYACRSVDKLVDEIASLNVPAVHITDDNFLVNREYLEEFIREATNDEELDSYNKHVSLHENEECIRILSENHIFCAGLFIVHQAMTKEDFKKLYKWIASRDIIPTVSVFTPMQGSAMYKDYEDKLITKDVTKQDLFHCLLKPEHMSVARFTFEYYKLSMGLAFKNRKSPLYADNEYFKGMIHIIGVLLLKLKRVFVL